MINISLDHREEVQLQTEEIWIATARQILVYLFFSKNIHDQLQIFFFTEVVHIVGSLWKHPKCPCSNWKKSPKQTKMLSNFSLYEGLLFKSKMSFNFQNIWFNYYTNTSLAEWSSYFRVIIILSQILFWWNHNRNSLTTFSNCSSCLTEVLLYNRSNPSKSSNAHLYKT